MENFSINMTYPDYIKAKLAADILNEHTELHRQFYCYYYPKGLEFFDNETKTMYFIWHYDNPYTYKDAYALLSMGTKDLKPEVVFEEDELDFFLVKTLNLWNNKEYTVEEIFSSAETQAVLKNTLKPCTIHWTFMLTIFNQYKESGFDNAKLRQIIKTQTKYFDDCCETSLSRNQLFLYTVEHFIRYTHNGIKDDTKYLKTLYPLVDYIFKYNIGTFKEMIKSYPDMSDLDMEEISELLSEMKAETLRLVRINGNEIVEDAHAHLQKKLENIKFLSCLFIGPFNIASKYHYSTEDFYVFLSDRRAGDETHKRLCELINAIMLNARLTEADFYYFIPPRWTWNSDKTRIEDLASGASFEPNCFKPDSKERKEADEAEKGVTQKPLPQNFSQVCDFGGDITIETDYILGYPDANERPQKRMAKIIISQSYCGRDCTCNTTISVKIKNYNTNFDQRGTCKIAKDAFQKGTRYGTWPRHIRETKPEETGIVFGTKENDEYIVNHPDEFETVDFNTLLELFPIYFSMWTMTLK